jgi:hypothetical protein
MIRILDFKKIAKQTVAFHITSILIEVQKELMTAMQKFPDFNSGHEGYAVLREEVDELWTEIKAKEANKDRIKKEAIQVAAMAIRLIFDLDYQAIEKERG